MNQEERPIIRLNEELIGKIAAGEVVENPASAIKEMVENSLDAGASAVTVEIRDGGISFLRVTDNGRGILSRDIRMAFERHATSKIASLEELYNIHTLGFRGEALASIAAVSRLTMTSRHYKEETGVRVVNEGGTIKSIDDAACPRGTTIVVRDLFYNTPVRLKFLKRPNTEASKVADMLSRMILSRPDVSFKLINNGKNIFQSSGTGDLKSAVFSIYGRETAENMVEVKSEGGISVTGLVGVGPEARSNRNRQTFIINGRCIRSVLLSQAVEEGARERYTIGHYPICVLAIDMPVSLVDVNVHPNKLEVRFSDENLIFQKVSAAVHDAFSISPLSGAPTLLSETEPVTVAPAKVTVVDTTSQKGLSVAAIITKPVSFEAKQTGSTEETEAEQYETQFYSQHEKTEQRSDSDVKPMVSNASTLSFNDVVKSFFTNNGESNVIIHNQEPQGTQTQIDMSLKADSQENLLDYDYIGIAFDTYIILQNKKQLLMIDQHAAHERILYEKLMREVDTGGGSQLLLVPQVVRVTPQDVNKLEIYKDEIKDAGYEIVPFGEDSYQIRAVPNVLGVPESKEAFLEMVDHLGELRVLSTRQKRRDAILQMACKKAIKGGEKISMEEVNVLLAEMQKTGAPPTCPHGRPLVVVINKTELEKRFKRINE